MTKETITYTKVCDACKKIKDEPTMLAGSFSTDGWTYIKGKDFCYVCFNLLAQEAINKLSDLDLKVFIDSREKVPNYKMHPTNQRFK